MEAIGETVADDQEDLAIGAVAVEEVALVEVVEIGQDHGALEAGQTEVAEVIEVEVGVMAGHPFRLV